MTSKIQDPKDFRIVPISTNPPPIETETRPRAFSANPKPQLNNIRTKTSISPSKTRLPTEPSKDFSQSFYGQSLAPTEPAPLSPTLKNKDSIKNYKRPVVRNSTYSHPETNSNDRAFQTKKRQFNLEGVKPKVVYDWPMGNSPLRPTTSTQTGTSPDRRPRIAFLQRQEEMMMQRISEQAKAEAILAYTKKAEHLEIIKDRIFKDYEAAHQEFLTSILVLDKLKHEIDLNHGALKTKVTEKKAEEIAKAAVENLDLDEKPFEFSIDFDQAKEIVNLERVLIHDTEMTIKEKLKNRGVRHKMKKHDVEDFGVTMTYYFRKLIDQLLEKGDTDAALQLISLNKLMAVQLEDIWINYTVQLGFMKKNPHQELLEEMAQDKFTIEQQKILIKKKDADHKYLVDILQKQLERSFDDKKRLEDTLREKQFQETFVADKMNKIHQLTAEGSFIEITPEEIKDYEKKEEIRQPESASMTSIEQ